MGINAASSCFFCGEGVSKDCANRPYTLNHTNIINAWEERCVVSTCRMLRIPSTDPAVAALLLTQNYCGGCMQVMRDLEFSVGAMDKLQQQILSLRQKLLNKLESKSERLKRLDSQSSLPSTNSTNSSQDLFDLVIEKAQDEIELTDDDFLLKNDSVLNESLQGSNNQEEEKVVEDIEIETKIKEEPLDDDALNPAEYSNESLTIEEASDDYQDNNSAKDDDEDLNSGATVDESYNTEEGPAFNDEIESLVKKEDEVVNSAECLDESLIIEEARDFNTCYEVDVSIKNEDQEMLSSEEEELEESDLDTCNEVNNKSRTEDVEDALQSEVDSLVKSNYEIIVKADEEEEESHSATAETCRDPLEFDRTLPSGGELEPVEIKRRLRYASLPKRQIEVSKPEKKKRKKPEPKEKILKIPRERPPKGPWGFNTDKLRKKRAKNWSTQKRREALKREARLKKLMEDAKLVVPCPDVSCRQRFESKHNLEIHIRQVHGGNSAKYFPCDKCDKKFGLPSSLKNHLLWHARPRIVKPVENRKPCSFCGTLLYLEEFEEHEGKHRARESPFSCLICEDVKFIRSSGLARHMMEEHLTEDLNLKKCHCGKTFTNSTSLTGHIRRVHEDPSQNFPCKKCRKIYKKAAQLEKHMKKCHSGPSDSKHVMCEKCGKIYSTPSQLATHMKTHSDVCQYKCRFCDKRFFKPQSVKKHEEIHAGLQFQCPDCPKSFSTQRYLSQHSRCHLPRELRKYYYKTKEPTETESSESRSAPPPPPEELHSVQLPSHSAATTATATSVQLDGNMEVPYYPNIAITNSLIMPVPPNQLLYSHFPYLN